MAMDGRSRKRQPEGMRPQAHPQRRAPPPGEPAGSGDLPEIIVDVVDAVSSPDAADLLGEVVDGVGSIVGAIGDVAS